MYKSRILYLLIVLTLASNLAWSMDLHMDQAAGQSHQTHSTDQNHNDDSENDTDCQHCCHMSVHVLGIPNSINFAVNESKGDMQTLIKSFTNHQMALLLRPPTV